MKQGAYLFFHRTASLVFVVLVACQPVTPAKPPTLSAPQISIASVTPSPIPRASLTPSPTPTIEELIFPYTMEGLRQHDFLSGKIHIRSQLSENDKFTTYLIDYPSDGLTITGVMRIPAGEGPFPVILMNHGFFSRSVYNSGDGTDRAS